METERKGEYYVLSSAILWSLFPVFTILSYANIGPLFSLMAVNFFATLFFLGVIGYKKKWHELTHWEGLKEALYAALLSNGVYYPLIFFGLQFTTAGNASLISLMTIFFSFVFFHVIRKDHIPKHQIIGAGLMIAGAIFVILPDILKTASLNRGDLLILIASATPPLSNFLQQRARKMLSSETILLTRTLFGMPVAFALALLLKETIDLAQLREAFWYILFSGAILFGLSKIFWVEGIHRISVTKSEALGALAPFFTLVFAFLLLKEIPTIYQILSLIPLFLGVLLLTNNRAILKYFSD